MQAQHRAYREANPQKRSALRKKWRLANPGKEAARRASRKAAELHRTPAWRDVSAIRFFYECRPEGCHVDHILPLRGAAVSGLHVAENLQWMPALDNLRKSNRYGGAHAKRL